MMFILIHGAWHDSRVWERIAPRLRQAGHEVRTPNLPGNGHDTTPARAVTLQTYVAAIVAEVGNRSGVCLVGHSMAGIVLSGVGEAIPDRVRHLVYVAAYMLPDGSSITSLYQETGARVYSGSRSPEANEARPFRRISPDGTFTTVDPVQARRMFCNTCNSEDAELACLRLGPQPIQPQRDPVAVTAGRWGRIPRTYLKTLRDNAVSPALQDAMIEVTPGTSGVDLDCDHSPFYSATEELTEILLSIEECPRVAFRA